MKRFPKILSRQRRNQKLDIAFGTTVLVGFAIQVVALLSVGAI